MSRKEETKNR